MPSRESELDRLLDQAKAYDVVDDAWLAKSFTDRLFVVALHGDAPFPDDLERLLAEHDLLGCNEVYELGGEDHSFVGNLCGGNRHHFVDVRTRGEHQSYVVD